MLVGVSGFILSVARLKGDSSMNAFYEHHKNNIRFHYRCFDRIMLNAITQPIQLEQRVGGFSITYRQLYPFTRDVLRAIFPSRHATITTSITGSLSACASTESAFANPPMPSRNVAIRKRSNDSPIPSPPTTFNTAAKNGSPN